jgi:splicing factor 45
MKGLDPFNILIVYLNPMSLFGDLPQAKGSNEASTTTAAWAAPALAPLAPQVTKPKPKTAAPFAPRAASGRQSNVSVGGGRAPAPGRGGGRTGLLAQAEAPALSLHNQSSLSSSDIQAIRDEYDPLRPNEYEEVLRMRERRKKEAEAEAERHRQLKEMEEMAAAQEAKALQEASQVKREEILDLSGEEAFLRRARLSGRNTTEQASTQDKDGASLPSESKGMSLAQKMLRKMGWKEGEGLGKDGQGMTTPLMAQKTDKNAGVIVNAPIVEDDARKRQSTEASLESDAKPRVGQRKTKVIVMRNMIGPGEVDEELEDEVRSSERSRICMEHSLSSCFSRLVMSSQSMVKSAVS